MDFPSVLNCEVEKGWSWPTISRARFMQIRIVGRPMRFLRSALTIRVSIKSRKPSSTPSASRSEEHTSELQSLMRISYAVFCLKNKKQTTTIHTLNDTSNRQIQQK